MNINIVKPGVFGGVCMAIVWAVCVLAVGGGIVWLAKTIVENVEYSNGNKIEMTATQIESIRDIGQWEFMAVDVEEMVDTTRRRLFGEDHLVRIYYGTLRLGIDLRAVDKRCIASIGDTLVLTVPDVGLLDHDFIDETRTRSFFESGSWTGKDRDDMYRRAQQRMMKRGVTPENLDATRRMAESQLLQMLRLMGFSNAVVRFK